MINRIYIKCNFCKTNILLRFQMGEFDIPFSFSAPIVKLILMELEKLPLKILLKLIMQQK